MLGRMTEEKRYQSFEEFWPFYVREHSNKTNRRLHFVGTTLAMGCVATGILTGRLSALLAAPVAGYGFAWVGHFMIEGNRPATFTYPKWSLMGDFKMWTLMATGKMDAEVERCMKLGEEESTRTPTNGVHAAAS